jgi:hypothetical protein
MPAEPTRAWIYRIITAAIPILTYYGIISDDAAPLILGLAAAFLGTGLAVMNTSVK